MHFNSMDGRIKIAIFGKRGGAKLETSTPLSVFCAQNMRLLRPNTTRHLRGGDTDESERRRRDCP